MPDDRNEERGVPVKPPLTPSDVERQLRETDAEIARMQAFLDGLAPPHLSSRSYVEQQMEKLRGRRGNLPNKRLRAEVGVDEGEAFGRKEE